MYIVLFFCLNQYTKFFLHHKLQDFTYFVNSKFKYYLKIAGNLFIFAKTGIADLCILTAQNQSILNMQNKENNTIYIVLFFYSTSLQFSRGLRPIEKQKGDLGRIHAFFPSPLFCFSARLIAITKVLIFLYIADSRFLSEPAARRGFLSQ